MGGEELLQYRNLSDRELLMVVIERQTNNQQNTERAHEELKRNVKALTDQIEELKQERSEKKGADKFIIWLIGMLGAIGTLLGIKNGIG